MALKLLDMVPEVSSEAGVICIEVVDSIAGRIVAYAFDVEVETDMTEALIVITALSEVLCKLSIWHHALAALGASVVRWRWGWGWTATT